MTTATTQIQHLMAFDLTTVEPEHDMPGAEKIIRGAPKFTTWNFEEARDGQLFSGIWEATPGAWSISYSEWEFCHILAGRSIITGDDGSRLEIGPGVSFVFRPGFSGVWDVIETTRKAYVILL